MYTHRQLLFVFKEHVLHNLELSGNKHVLPAAIQIDIPDNVYLEELQG